MLGCRKMQPQGKVSSYCWDAGRYLCYLLFQLKTHSSFFSESEGDGEPALSLVAALGALAGITCIVAVCSECAPPSAVFSARNEGHILS